MCQDYERPLLNQVRRDEDGVYNEYSLEALRLTENNDPDRYQDIQTTPPNMGHCN